MRIENITKKTVLSSDITRCTTPWQKASGLMFRSQQDLLFVEKKEQRISLHMWFVFYPIDVVYCTAEKKVVEIKEHFMPWTFYFPQQKATYVLELRSGTIQKTKTEVNDLLLFQ